MTVTRATTSTLRDPNPRIMRPSFLGNFAWGLSLPRPSREAFRSGAKILVDRELGGKLRRDQAVGEPGPDDLRADAHHFSGRSPVVVRGPLLRVWKPEVMIHECVRIGCSDAVVDRIRHFILQHSRSLT